MRKINNSKIEIIKENKEDFIIALTSLLDRVYSLKETFYDENGNLEKGLPKNERVESMLNHWLSRTDEYEKLRLKLKENNFNFTTTEINEIAMAGKFLTETWGYQIEASIKGVEVMKQAKIRLEKIWNEILESEKVDINENL